MGIEKLSAAARAAGFAMATSEDLLTSPPRRPVTETNPWQSVDARQSTSRSSGSVAIDLRKNIYSLFGWSATA